MKAVKGNKEYQITEGQKKTYQDAGFDIIGDDGKTVAYGRGKSVTYEEHVAVLEENEKLKEELESLKNKKGRKTANNSKPADVGEAAEGKESEGESEDEGKGGDQ